MWEPLILNRLNRLADIYLDVTQQGIGPDIVQLAIENAITHHPGKRFGEVPKFCCVEGNLTVSHVGWELLETGQQVLVLTEDGAETLLLRPFGHLTHKLEQALAGGGNDEVLVFWTSLYLQAADWCWLAILFQGVDLPQDKIK